jgi:hypothetical protein
VPAVVLKYDDESTEMENMNSQEKARGPDDCYESLNNRQVIALCTPLTDPCQLAMVKLPHPLNLCLVKYILFSKPGELCKEGRKSAFHILCPSSSKADIEHNCSSTERGINDGNVSLGKCNSNACSNEDHKVRDFEGNVV